MYNTTEVIYQAIPMTEERETALEKAHRMQDQLVSFSTNGGFEGGDEAYRKLRGELLAAAGDDDLFPELREAIPRPRRLLAVHQAGISALRRAPRLPMGEIPAAARSARSGRGSSGGPSH